MIFEQTLKHYLLGEVGVLTLVILQNSATNLADELYSAERGILMTENCVSYRKKLLLKFIMSAYNLKAKDIAQHIHVSDSLVRKHIDGVRNCPLVDMYIVQHCFGITAKDFV